MRSLWLDINRSLKDETSRQSRIERALFSEVRETKTNKHTQKKIHSTFSAVRTCFFFHFFSRSTLNQNILFIINLCIGSHLLSFIYSCLLCFVCVCVWLIRYAEQQQSSHASLWRVYQHSLTFAPDFFFFLSFNHNAKKHKALHVILCPPFFFCLHKLWLRPCVHYSYESLKDSVNINREDLYKYLTTLWQSRFSKTFYECTETETAHKLLIWGANIAFLLKNLKVISNKLMIWSSDPSAFLNINRCSVSACIAMLLHDWLIG